MRNAVQMVQTVVRAMKAQGMTEARQVERATQGAKAMAEYNAEREAERAKTARLKALRLAKEVAEKKKK